MRTMWKTRIAPLAVAFVTIGGIIGGLTTLAAAGPLPGTGCPKGYVAAFTDRSYGGGATGGGGSKGGSTGTSPLSNEITGLGCVKVGSSTANLKFTWATSGKLLEGIFYYQLIDCGANKVVGSKTMEYPNGTSKKTASASAKFKVVKGHKYKMRVRGQGSYQRRPDSLGALGFFYGMAGTGVKPWMAESSCVKAK